MKDNNHSYYFMKYTIQMIKQGFDFSGRATRTDFWMPLAEEILLFGGLAMLAGLFSCFNDFVGACLSSAVMIFLVIYLVIIIIPRIALIIRRCHDANVSPWVLLCVFVPIAGPFVPLVIACMKTYDPDDEQESLFIQD